jgi:orotate phosphoribosyltransferase
MTHETIIAEYLLQSNAIKLQPANPFTWASGWKSPIYCDNRITLSFPEIRNFIRDAFVDTIERKTGLPDVIAGVATGAIAQGAMVADELQLPFIYVRSAPKDHGLGNLIEGRLEKNQTVIVIEDLVSTGSSSLQAVEAIRKAGGIVKTMLAVFTYGFPVADKKFKEAGCQLITLSNYGALIDYATDNGLIDPLQVDILKKWREDPANWKGI